MSRMPKWTTLSSSRLRVFAWSLVSAWTLLAGLLVWSSWIHHDSQMRDRVHAEAFTHLCRDQSLRLWATSHGGVYVTTDDRTPPNPHLAHVPERDIKTPSGQALTLMNPAYMLRQVTQEYSDLYGVKGHITSLKPLAPGNAPDAWERAVLESFERGKTEALEFTEIDGQPYFRLMRPIVTERGCLKCHAHQGYEEGDIRGGISVSTPMASLLAEQRRELATALMSYGSVWLLGLGGIVLGYRRVHRGARNQEHAFEELWESEERYRIVAERTGCLIRDYHVSPPRVEWSGAIGELTGCTELSETDIPVWEEMIHPDDRQQVLTVVAETMRDCSRYLVEYRLREKDASYIHVEERGVFLDDEAGRAYRLLAVIEDITPRKHAEEERAKMLHDMEERVKELTCIFGVAQSIRERETLEEVFQKVVALIPPGWHYPEITRAKIRFQGKEFVSEPFEETEWKQTSDILVDGEVCGSVEVYYLQRCPELDEGPFMKEECGLIGAIARALSEAVNRKRAEKDLRRIEWLLTKKLPVKSAHKVSEDSLQQPYGDLTQLNSTRLVLDSVGEDLLAEIADDSLRLLDTSIAIYEKNGDYALGIFASGWCKFLDNASRNLCGTDSDEEALQCGKWHCHESCWSDVSKVAIETGQTVDAECRGGIRLYGIPIRAGKEIVGAINFGYGDPPKDPERLREIAQEYGVPVEELLEQAKEYDPRPSFITDTAKERLRTSATLIGEIVDRRQMEKEREKLIVSLETQNAELERYAYTMSHELKTPLVTMGLYMGSLREDMTTGDTDAIDGDFTRMSAAADKMVELLDSLLELSKVGRLVRRPEEVALTELTREALELVSRQIQEKGIQIDISPDLPVVFSDRTRLFEVMQNLIDNAIKFVGDQPKPHIEIGVRRENGETVCFVRDNGLGIDSCYQEKVFGLFDQLDQKVEGSGVGLALVKRIVEFNGGRIWVESPGVGQGSTFCFTLSTKTSSATQEKLAASTAP